MNYQARPEGGATGALFPGPNLKRAQGPKRETVPWRKLKTDSLGILTNLFPLRSK